MLSGAEEQAVRVRFNASDQDFFFRWSLAGEPFLHHGLLSYFDGVTVDVVGFPFDPSLSDKHLTHCLEQTLDDWCADPRVQMVNYTAPVRCLTVRPGWLVTYERGPEPCNVDVFIDLEQPLLPRKKVRQDVSRAQRRGIEVHHGRRAMLGHDHLALMSALVARTEMTVADACGLANLPSILRDPCTSIFEAVASDRLVGFTVAHEYFAPIAMVVGAAFDRGTTGASDAVYAAMLDHYQSRGCVKLGLGYSADEHLYSYKTKWGSPLLGRPFCYASWARSNAFSFLQCEYWPWRLLRSTSEANGWRAPSKAR